VSIRNQDRAHIVSGLRLALLFLGRLREGDRPSAAMLAVAIGRHKRTAQRIIRAFRREFNCPIVYDQSRNGYYLSDPSWKLEL